MKIGPYTLENQLILAPMAGVTDGPFCKLCQKLGAGLVVSEMISSDPKLQNSRKTQLRLNHEGVASPRSIQIVGGEPMMMADAACRNVDLGAEIIDINMGCPAKKVCNKAAGSALLKDEKLVTDILNAVVNAVDVPVTLKIRTGWNRNKRNAVTIAKIAEDQGIAAIAIHGRTRECGYANTVEYDTITQVAATVNIPVIANGDITHATQAKDILRATGADALMLGRAAQGNPWIFSEIDYYLKNNHHKKPLTSQEIYKILLGHVQELYEFYGDFLGVRIARKHVGWYCKTLKDGQSFRRNFNRLETMDEQMDTLRIYFDQLVN